MAAQADRTPRLASQLEVGFAVLVAPSAAPAGSRPLSPAREPKSLLALVSFAASASSCERREKGE